MIFLPVSKYITRARLYVTQINKEMKYLNVAEKNDAAKTIASFLANGSAQRREGFSVYNKIYEFEDFVHGKKSKMVMTSVSGHLMQLEFMRTYRNWNNCNPVQLFDAPIHKVCHKDFLPIKKTLEREIKSCQGLIVWTDCDREGENIAFEIIEVCTEIKPNIKVFRAKFSEITCTSVRRALENLVQPDKHQSDAVNVRSELDLRTGAAITRLQTLRLQRLFPEKIANKLISYGSCQIPTLGFVAERYKEVDAFVSEPFWKVKVSHTIDDLTVDFNWARNRLFDKEACEDYLMLCLADPKAKIESISVKPKNKWRPTPMDTVEMEKLSSRKLKLSAKETMTIAEKLYTQGIISYPRTETNLFSKDFDLKHLVEQQIPHSIWGDFAQRVNEWGPNPRNGTKSDQAHPPIHPIKLVTSLSGNEARVYELIVRHFLACVSKDATGSETIVNIDIAGEKFTATGLCIYERNYLEVYIYEKWNAKQIHKYENGQVFDPTEISIQEGATTAPPLLTEADLIVLMEKHGIGTDATHAEHINTIKERGYIGETDRGCLVPGVIGMGLYEGYDAMDLVLAKPMLRAEFESDLKKICLGQKDPKVVLREQIQKYKEAYKVITEKVESMDEKMALRINETPKPSAGKYETNESLMQELFKCPKCLISLMTLRRKKDLSGYYICCTNFPDCKNTVWLSDELKEVSVSQKNCNHCGSSVKKIKLKLSSVYYRSLFDIPDGWYETCLKCDSKFRQTFNINADQVKQVGAIVSDSRSIIKYRSNNNMFNQDIKINQIPKKEPVSRVANVNVGVGTISTSCEIFDRNRRSLGENGLGSSKGRLSKLQRKPTTNKKCTAQEMNIQTFTTSSLRATLEQSDPDPDPDRNLKEINDFLQNDEFEDVLANADFDVGVSEQPAAVRPSQNDGDDLSSLFMNDDFDDYSWGTSDRSRIESVVHTGNAMQMEGVYQRGQGNENQIGIEIELNEAPNSDAGVDNITVKCTGCHQTAKQLNVKKGGPNKGRTFFACPKTNQCNFFQWADETQQNPTGSKPSNLLSKTDVIKCNCQIPVSSLIVRKDGPNQGRPFNACANRNKPCKFFKWSDELPMNTDQMSDLCGMRNRVNSNNETINTSKESTSSTSNMKKAERSQTNTRNKRKCGFCRQEGHIRSKCPRKSQFEI